MSNFYQKLIQSTLIAGGIFATTPPAWADSFTVNNGETVGRQVLIDSETGLIESGGFINSTTQGIAISDGISTNITITNNGTITSFNDAIEGPGGDNTGAIATVINNGTITTTANSANADAVNFGGATAPTLILTNNGTIQHLLLP